MDLVEFVEARLAEDEQVASAAMPGPWIDGYVAPEHLADGIVYGQSSWIGHLGQACDVRLAHVSEGNAAHIARHDPARVLAEVKAKRELLEWHPTDPLGHCRCQEEDGVVYGEEPCPTKRLLVLPYADHPECHPSWLPAVKT